MGIELDNISKSRLPKLPAQYAVSKAVQFVSIVKVAFKLSLGCSTLKKVVSLIPEPYKARLSIVNTKLSLLGVGGGLPLLTGLSLPQATISSKPNIFKCSMAFLTEFKTLFILRVISGLRFIVSFASGVNSLSLPFTFLIPVSLSNLSLCHLIVWRCSFLTSFFNFFTHKYNEFTSQFQMNKYIPHFIVCKPFYIRGLV